MGSTYFTKRCKAALAQNKQYRKKRPKTFKSEEKAHAWAQANNISKYSLENLRTPDNPKVRIVKE
ncbi:hypothetical protein JW868_03245 [Candidatus Woesearchaeota archaeon]|nr:hypothetical protein [Candidatus Woesearchaeota archaeon]